MAGSITLDPRALTEQLTVLSEDHVGVDRGIWEAVACHMEQSRAIKIEYERFDGQRGSYWLEPYHLVAYHGNWYVLGRDVDKGRVGAFALSRVREIQGTGAVYAWAAGFDAKAWLEGAFGITRSSEQMKVRLQFSPKVAAYTKEHHWHQSQELRPLAKGGVELCMVSSGWKELVRWTLFRMPNVTVVSPASLRLRVLEKLREGMAANSGAPA